MKKLLLVSVLICGFQISHALAGALEEARIDQIVNDVKVIESEKTARNAVLQDVISGDRAVVTGIESRAELVFQDNTLTRLGAESLFTFQPGTRNINLNRGSMLLQVPKNIGGAHIRAASVSASITGTTIMIENQPGKKIVVLVLEGSLKVNLVSNPADTVTLTAGKMLTMSPNDKQLPKPVSVNLKHIVQNSTLINPTLFNGKSKATAAVLPSMNLIEDEIAQQPPNMDATKGTEGSGSAEFGGVDKSQPVAGTSKNDGSPSTSNEAGVSGKGNVVVASVTGDNNSIGGNGSTEGASGNGDNTPAKTQTSIPFGNSNPLGSTVDVSISQGSTIPTNISTGLGNIGTGIQAGSGINAGLGIGLGINGEGSGSTFAASGTGSAVTTGSTSVGSGTGSVVNTGSSGGTVTGTGGPLVITNAPLPVPIIVPPANANPTPTNSPVLIPSASSYVIDATTIINTNNQGSTIVTNGASNNGSFYKNLGNTGSPSKFLFGSSLVFDGQMNFDSQFDHQFSNSAVYLFSALDIEGQPTFVTQGGAKNVALISAADITSSTVPGQVALNGAQQLFLGTVNGSITINNGLSFNKVNGVNFNFLELYSRNGNIEFGAPVSMSNGSFYIQAQNDITIDPISNIQTSNLSLTGMGNVSVNGSINSNVAQFYAGATLTTSGTITGSKLNGYGTTVNLGGMINAQQGVFQAADLTLNSGASLGAQQINLTAGDVLDIQGTVTGTNNLTLSAGNLVLTGTVNAPPQFQVTADNVTIGGVVSGSQSNSIYTLKNSLAENAGAVMNIQALTITAGDSISLGAVSASQNITLTSGTTSAQPGVITLNGPVQSQGNFVATGNVITLNAPLSTHDVTFAAASNIVLSANGGITSTGNTTLTAPILIQLDGNITTNNLTFSGSANVVINGTLGAKTMSNTQSSLGDFTLNGAASLANDLNITNTGNFTVGGTGSLVSGGNVTLKTSKNVVFDGPVSANNVNLTSGANLGLAAGNNLQATQNLTLSAVNTSILGGLNATAVNITSSGNATISLNSFYAKNATINVTGLLTLQGQPALNGGPDLSQLTSLSASGQGILIQSSFAFSSGNSSLTAGSQGIDATGFDVSGMNSVTVNNGSYKGRNLSTNSLNVTGGNVSLSGTLSTVGAVNVAGNISASTINAAQGITAQSLTVDNLTTSSLTLGTGGITSFSGGLMNINATTIKSPLGILMNGAAGTLTTAPGGGGSLNLATGALTVDSSGNGTGILKSVSLDGGNASLTNLTGGGSGGLLQLNLTGDLTVNSAISADTGNNSIVGLTGGNGGAVNVTTTGAITANSKIKVSSAESSSNSANNTPGRASVNGGNINLTSTKTNGTAITVNNTGQLLSLLNSVSAGKGGTIQFVSAGGNIVVNGGTVQADHGNVTMVNNGAGNIQLTNAILSGNVVKVGALGPNGQLMVGGGTINADTTLKLYGGTTNGQVVFTNNVTLGGLGTKIIAGKTVTINSGKTVTISGLLPASVYADTANYAGSGGNGSTTGRFGGAGATTQAFKNAPAF